MLAALLAAALAATSLAFASAPAAAAEGPVRVDRVHGVRFELDGRILTVRILPGPDGRPPEVTRRVWGKRIDAICSPVFHPRSPSTIVRQIRRWPRGELELRYRFGRDISGRVKWCVLEDGGVDVAAVGFGAIIRVFGNNADDKRAGRQLRRHIKAEAPSATWLPRVKAIVVTEGLITVSTDLEKNRGGRRVARRICGLIRSSGAAAPPPGGPPHTVLGRDDAGLRDCARSR
jgi:hypothetical protein